MEKIKEFLSVNYGYGFGDGSGSGYGSSSGSGYGYGKGYGFSDGNGKGNGSGNGSGNGYSNGNGYGDGSGSGSGYGSGKGYGYDSGDGISQFNTMYVHLIDGIQTIITHIKGNVAKGFILNSDLTLSPCFIAKHNNLFAHGETLKKAQEALQNKLFEGLSIDERISEFNKEFKDGKKYPVMKFFDWHNKLTGSCEIGRKSFAKDKGIDLEHDKMTVDEFIELTKNAYGSEIIRKIKKN